MRLKLHFLIPAAILIAGCAPTPDDYPGEPNVYALITADSTHAHLMVGRTVSVADTLPVDTIVDTFWIDDSTFETWTYYQIPWNGTSNADVILESGGDNFTLTEHPDSQGYYFADITAPRAGQSWTLKVTYPEGEEISARTTIPGNFEITGPDNDTLTEDDTVRWTASDGARGYQVSILQWLTYEEEDTASVEFISWPLLVSADTLSVPLSDMGFSPMGDSVCIYIISLDTNAYDYKYYGENMWMVENIVDCMHIEGAWGVFGAGNVVRSKTFSMDTSAILPGQ
ncbi:DUF4249 family protein [candidate division WOR-3 bacterium]|uniref:DUF4249 family protein n=1 Tax=candidate division WOR-3 bacterium TaxID=2052148 RepID=A0A9D5K8B3_UNCW3|nr:DUF4249 family protein [candidate division WOR-3 bacterium]MBD3364148.1 DUF4249 family protein [candidate division WOR-3 bacterium]